MNINNESSISLRQKAIQYLSDPNQRRSQSDCKNFRPYLIERDLGGLIGISKNKTELSQQSFEDSVISKYRFKTQGGDPRPQSLQKYLETYNLEVSFNKISPEHALLYKEQKKSKAMDQLMKISQSTNLQNDQYRWNMNCDDRQALLKQLIDIPKKQKCTPQRKFKKTESSPSVGCYDPLWGLVLPKTIQNIKILPRFYQQDEIKVIKKKFGLIRKPAKTLNFSKETTTIHNDGGKLYASIQNQVRREVRQSIRTDPKVMLDRFNLQPMDKNFVEDFKIRYNEHLVRGTQILERMKWQLRKTEE